MTAPLRWRSFSARRNAASWKRRVRRRKIERADALRAEIVLLAADGLNMRRRLVPPSACRARHHGMRPKEHHPHGLLDREFDALFATDRPVIFAYYGYP